MTDPSEIHFGVCLLQDETEQDPPRANLTFIDNGMFGGQTYIPDENKYRLLSAASPDYVLPETPSPGDYRILPSAGPIDLAPGEQREVAFAILGGESLEELENHTQVARLIHWGGISDAPDEESGSFLTRLLPSAPNPFRQEALIRFDLERPGEVKLKIYDVAGRQVRSLLDGPYPAGRYALAWDGRNNSGVALSGGVYFARLIANGRSESQRLVRLR